MDPLMIVGAVAVNAALVLLWWSVSSGREPSVDLQGRGDSVQDLRTMLLREAAGERAVRPFLERIGARVGKLAPAERLAALQAKIDRSGMAERWPLDRVLAAKVLLAAALGSLMLLRAIASPSLGTVLLTVVAFGFGWFVPNGLLDSRGEARKLAVRAELADAIDQLAVMVRAGLGIDSALARTARASTGPLGVELTRVVRDMRVGVSRSQALAAMGERIDVPELRSFVTALAQAEALGVPIAQTLQVQSEELRLKRRQLAEEQAMKLPVKILFPMVLCILPTLFIVLLGPAMMRILDQFGT